MVEHPMKVFEATIDIDAPTHIVWAHLTDFASYPEWNPFILRAAGDLVEGSVVTFNAYRVPTQLNATIVSLVPEREFIWEANMPLPGMQPRYIRKLEALSNDRTRFINREEFAGFLIPVLSPILTQLAGNIYEETCLALKNRVEGLQTLEN